MAKKAKRKSGGSKKKNKKKAPKKKLSKVKKPAKPIAPEEPVRPGPCQHYIPDESCDRIVCQPNKYPSYLEKPMPISIVGSETGTYQSIFGLLNASLKCADRIFLMVPWGNYVIFNVLRPKGDHSPDNTTYFLYDGCTCNVNSFRHLDLRAGTAGFVSFSNMNSLVSYVMNSRFKREKLSLLNKPLLDDICKELCTYGEKTRCAD